MGLVHAGINLGIRPALPQGPAFTALKTWDRLETLFSTSLSEEMWREHWAQVRRNRRTYAFAAAGYGIVAGGFAATGATLIPQTQVDGGPSVWSAVWLLLLPLVLGRVWRGRMRTTVAPLLQQPRHIWPRWTFPFLYTAVLVASFFVPESLGWTSAAALIAAFPLWASAAMEAGQPVPPYPAAWRKHTAADADSVA